MSKQANMTLIGAFVVGALALLTVGIVVFGSGRLFSRTNRYVVYFDGSVKGLKVGAPVSFRGAPIGSVLDIRLVYNEDDQSILIPVVFEINPAKIYQLGEQPHRKSDEEHEETVRTLIDKGLRAELAMESFVTGQLFIQLDYHPDTPVRFINQQSDLMEMPSIPSGLEQLKQQIKELPLKETVASLQNVLVGIDKFITSNELEQAVVSFDQLMVETQGFVKHLDQQIDPAGETIGEMKGSAAAARQAFVTLEQFIAKGSPLRYKVDLTLNEIASAARALRVFAGYLERHPEALLQGKSGGRK